ncbi:MAG TPA: hypothetical protein VLK33_01760 [Terriglobales bacterium]|nr:hypothetical protein [Terriglobales bacterium]
MASRRSLFAWDAAQDAHGISFLSVEVSKNAKLKQIKDNDNGTYLVFGIRQMLWRPALPAAANHRQTGFLRNRRFG